MKYYIEIKYSKHASKSKETIMHAMSKINYHDPDCEISEIIVRTKP